jgi:hypothetical protein
VEGLKRVEGLRRLQQLKYGTEQLDDRINQRELAVATNLAGRGTDLKVSDGLEQAGGLHVVVGFLPRNLRVQLQGIGRAGRNGCRGSGEVVVNASEHLSRMGYDLPSQMLFEASHFCNLKALEQMRDMQE